ncbi:hypothetical protein TraAM80_05493 [Trypanosoma rangeli]|uniref:Treble clef zinc finger domain-containing protein n=1 Tax=Trypanosoma rangeli TaxID=5698 RepID=A0A422NEK7_TRYRA|nr:uncharacterized protein TraAM80_05493 [Trypanosoma rangeli]RNF03895.1 hypothetical protein TraAM80_05493 [Trypanosoma rangeli]|eukprot:RNF03895.1 hypothetical protein TraAM80_05493 [Trypanosoma rangeli]
MRRVVSRWAFASSAFTPTAAIQTRSRRSFLSTSNDTMLSHVGVALSTALRCSSSTAAYPVAAKKTRRGWKKAPASEDEVAVASTTGKRGTRRRSSKAKSAEVALEEAEEDDELDQRAMFDVAGVDEATDGGRVMWEEEQQKLDDFNKDEDAEVTLSRQQRPRTRQRQSSSRAVPNDDALDDDDEVGEDDKDASGGASTVEDAVPSLGEESRFLKDRFPDLAAEYDTEANQLPLDKVVFDGAQVASWKCVECGFKWKSGIFVRTCLRTKCPQCEKERNPCLDGRFVQLWDHSLNDPCIDPKGVVASSNKSAFWRCPSCGTSFQARIKDMVADKAKCPSCSLLNLHADFSKDENGLLQEWHPLKNGDLQPSQVKPTDHTKLWWLCMACGHEWEATLAARLTRSRRTKGKECPVCHGKGKD